MSHTQELDPENCTCNLAANAEPPRGADHVVKVRRGCAHGLSVPLEVVTIGNNTSGMRLKFILSEIVAGWAEASRQEEFAPHDISYILDLANGKRIALVATLEPPYHPMLFWGFCADNSVTIPTGELHAHEFGNGAVFHEGMTVLDWILGEVASKNTD